MTKKKSDSIPKYLKLERKKGLPTSERNLTAKQRLFVAEYLANTGNGTEAAIKAGYSKTSAKTSASRMLKKPHVKAAITKAQNVVLEKLMKKYEVTEERVLKERARIAFFNAADLFAPGKNTLLPPMLWPDDVGHVIQGITENNAGDITVKLASKEQSLSALEKHLGMYAADNEQKATPLSEVIKELQGNGLKL